MSFSTSLLISALSLMGKRLIPPVLKTAGFVTPSDPPTITCSTLQVDQLILGKPMLSGFKMKIPCSNEVVSPRQARMVTFHVSQGLTDFPLRQAGIGGAHITSSLLGEKFIESSCSYPPGSRLTKHWHNLYMWAPDLKSSQLLLPGKSHGRRSLVGCSPWGR